MFQILEFVEAKLCTVTARSEKHGEDDVPAVSLGLEIEAANTLLDSIDPTIRPTLYKAVDDQEQLPGVEPSTPVLRCNSFEKHTLPAKYEGWTLQIDDGIDDTQPMTFGGCKIDKFSFEAKQGGTIALKFRAGTSDLDKERSGFLGMHVGQSVWITLKAPEKKPDAIDGSVEAFKADHPDAGDIFASAHGEGEIGPEDEADEESEGGDTDASGSDEPWPFPKSTPDEAPPQSVTTEHKRTERGRAAMKSALAEGAKAHAEG
jgi:hypothetical protein